MARSDSLWLDSDIILDWLPPGRECFREAIQLYLEDDLASGSA